MVHVLKAVEGLREFQTYWLNASEEDKQMFFAVLSKDQAQLELGMLVETLKQKKEEEDEYFPYE